MSSKIFLNYTSHVLYDKEHCSKKSLLAYNSRWPGNTCYQRGHDTPGKSRDRQSFDRAAQIHVEGESLQKGISHDVRTMEMEMEMEKIFGTLVRYRKNISCPKIMSRPLHLIPTIDLQWAKI